jgi:hypothetical protein
VMINCLQLFQFKLLLCNFFSIEVVNFYRSKVKVGCQLISEKNLHEIIGLCNW